MSLLSITDVQVIDPLSSFGDLLKFKISFNCMEELPGDLEWNLIWVGSATSSQYDQVVDSVCVPTPPGNHTFDFYSENPIDPSRIQEGQLLGPTVLILNAAYNDQEFVRVGYYVNVAYSVQEMNENPPACVDFNLLTKEILATEPRVTRFKINWTEQGEKYSISDQAVEASSNNIGSGLSDAQLMTGQDENVPPAALLANASENTILSNRMEAILAGLNDNSNSGSMKAGFGLDLNENSNSMGSHGVMN